MENIPIDEIGERPNSSAHSSVKQANKETMNERQSQPATATTMDTMSPQLSAHRRPKSRQH